MMRDRSLPFAVQYGPTQPSQEPRHWSLQAPGLLRTAPGPTKMPTAAPTNMPSIASPNLNAPVPRGPATAATSSQSRSKAISLPASPTLSSTDLTLLAYDPIPLFALDTSCSSPTHDPFSLDHDGANETEDDDDDDDDDDPMDTADDGECTSRTRGARTLIPYPHVRSVSDSHHHILLGSRGLKRAKSIGKGGVVPGSGDAPKISSYFRTLKRTGAAHGPGLFSKSLSDPTLAPASSAVVGRSFKRAGTPAMGGTKAHGGAAAMSSYFTKPGSFKAKPVAFPFASTRTGQQKTSSPSRGTLGSSYAAKSILADAFERMSISPSTRPLQAPQVGAGMGFVDGAMATVQFEAQQASSGGFAASSAVTEYGYAIGFPGRRG